MASTAGTDSPALATPAARLARGELFSALAAELAGGPVVCARLRREIAPSLSPREAYLLEVHHGRSGLVVRRSALLRGPAGAVARVTAVYLPARIEDPDVRRALWESDVPLGVALGPLGVTRRSLRVAGLRSAGLLLLGDTPAALAEEELFSPPV
jgi:hypothetical protein